MLAALISAVSKAIEILFAKVIVGEKNMTGLKVLKIQMFFISILMIIPVLIWGSILPIFLTPEYILLFIALVAVGLLNNLLYFTALSKKNVCEVEPIAMLATPITIFLAMLVLTTERNPILLVIALIATAALLLSRIEKKHLDFDKYSLMLMGHNILIAFEAILVKELLVATNAISLYGIRTALIALILFLLFKKIKVNKLSKKEYAQTFINSGITSVEFVAKFIAIGLIGVVNSSLILLLGPILILVFSKIFLKEKITLKRGLGDLVILLCIGAMILLGV